MGINGNSEKACLQFKHQLKYLSDVTTEPEYAPFLVARTTLIPTAEALFTVTKIELSKKQR